MQALPRLEEIKKVGKTTINYMPKFRYIVVLDSEKNNESKKRLSSVGLIDPNTLSDKERIDLGLNSKVAELANKDSENQSKYEVVATGPEVSCTKIGEMVGFMPGAQGFSINVDDTFYMVVGEHEALGDFGPHANKN